jgi:hypothetical protein
MVLDDMARAGEPEDGKLGEDTAFVRDSLGENYIERRDTIRGDQKQRVAADSVNIADFTGGMEGQTGYYGLEDDRGDAQGFITFPSIS